MSKALVIVDMLHDFIRPEGKLHFERGAGVIDAVVRLRQAFRQAGLPVLYDNDAHPPDSEEFKAWPPHCIAGSEGAQVIEELTPAPDDLILEKDSLSLFSIPNVAERLRDMGLTDLYLAGVATEYCVRFAAVDGAAAGFRMHVVGDAIAGVELEPGDIQAALEAMRNAGAVFTTTEAVLRELAAGA